MNGYKIKAPCGRVYFVPLEKVRADYAAYCNEEGEDDPAIKESDVHTWFHDNYTWEEVERDGFMTDFSSQEEVKAALDLVRDEASPCDCATLEDA